MKKLMNAGCLMLVLVCAVMATAPKWTAGDAPGFGKGSPDNMVTITLSDNDGTDNYDTLATTTSVFFGPYSLCQSLQEPGFESFRIHAAKGCLVATTDSVIASYQVLPTPTWADTGAWTVIDTIRGSGEWTAKVTIPEGNFIVFRIQNSMGTTAVIKNYFRVVFKKATQYFKTR